MTEKEAYVYMLERALDMAKNGWKIGSISDTRCQVVKYYPAPRWPRELMMKVIDCSWGKTVSNTWTRRPCRCEVCDSTECYADMPAEDGQAIVACKACYDKYLASGAPRGILGVVEWGWSDICGQPGPAGVPEKKPDPESYAREVAPGLIFYDMKAMQECFDAAKRER